MALVAQVIKNLIAGISQQPPILRFPEQGAEQINGWSSTTDGLQKRPPTQHVAYLNGSLGAFPLVHTIYRDGGEKYFMTISGGHIRMFTMDGVERHVHFPHGKGYLANANERRDLRVVTVADYSFIVNRNVTVQASPRRSPSRNHEALVAVKSGQFGRWYTVIINGHQYAAHKTPDGSDSSHSQYLATDLIMQELANQLVANLAPHGWGISCTKHYIHIVAPAGSGVFKIEVSDGFGGTAISGFTRAAQRFNMLPAVAPDGYHVEITGEAGNSADTYFVRFDEANRVWKETVAQNVELGVEPSTMPHILKRLSDGTFSFEQASWVDRKAGDDDSNPLPSFVGKRIRDVFFFRNRLGFLADENIVMSVTGEFFTFFNSSVVNLGDADPIDVAVSHNRVSTLFHAVPFGEELLLFGAQTQFVLRSSGVLSPRDVRLDQATEYDCDPFTRPINAGRRVYFHVERSRFSAMKEYYSAVEDSAVKATMDITAHCPNYIPNGIHRLVASTTEDIICALTDGAPSKMFIYKYLFIEDSRVQSSWSTWDFGAGVKVLGAGFTGSRLNFLLERDGQLCIEAMTFTSGLPDYAEEPYRVHLDRKRRIAAWSGHYDELAHVTVFDLKPIYPNVPDYTKYALVLSDGTAVQATADGAVRMFGDTRGMVSFAGKEMPFLFVFSPFMIKQPNDQGGSTAENGGRLQLRYGYVDYGNSGTFNVKVKTQSRTYTYTESGRRLGSSSNVLAQPPIQTNRLRFPIQSLNVGCEILIESSEPTPLALISAGWEGLYFRRSQRI